MKNNLNKTKNIKIETQFDINILDKNEIENQIMYYNDNYLKLKDTLENERQDIRLQKLKELDPENPLLNIISSDLDENIPKVKHDIRMLSLLKITDDKNGLLKWLEDKNTNHFMFQPKLDGHSLSILYENGNHILSKVRGDGEYGNDVTKNSKFIKGVLNKISDTRKIEIRGEAIIKNSDFALISGKFENARNGISLVKPKTTQDIIDRKMSFVAYNIFVDGKNVYDEAEKFKILESLGFEIPFFEVFEKEKLLNLDFLSKTVDKYDNFRSESSELDYMIDGLVIKVNDKKEQEELGENNHDPEWAVAYKFLSEEKNTKLLNVEWNVSRKGYLIPVGILEKIELSGTSVSRVTLNNFSYIKDGDIRLGDELTIRKSGEIIPFLVKNISAEERSNQNGEEHINYPSTCPSCNSHLGISGVHLICNNISCKEKNKKQIEFFASSLDIENLGSGIVNSLYENNVIQKPEDIFSLTRESFSGLEGFGDTLANKILNNIEKIKKSVTPAKVLKSIGIDGLGERMAIKILKKYGNIKNLINTVTTEDLSNIDGIGNVNSSYFFEELISNKDLIMSLAQNLNMFDFDMFGGVTNKLDGKSFCITGTLSRGRKEIEDLIENNGGANKKDINKNTHYLILGEGGGSKLDKAKKIIEAGGDIKIISEEEFMTMLS